MYTCSKCKAECGENGFYSHRDSWCKGCKKAYIKAYQKSRKRKLYNYPLAKAKYRETHREELRAKSREYQKANKKAILARCRAYQCRKMMAMPHWVDKIDLELIYKCCPPGQHVDHIIPLRGKNVSGLHVPWNLQYLPASVNQRKSNKVA